MPEGLVCTDIGNYVPGAELKFDQAEQAIYLSVPQCYLRLTTSKNYVDPQRWDSGVPALLLILQHQYLHHGEPGTQHHPGLRGPEPGGKPPGRCDCATTARLPGRR
ncbi:FimD/PapC N-terminal domain-containing protein [Cupriavidus basilensis]